MRSDGRTAAVALLVWFVCYLAAFYGIHAYPLVQGTSGCGAGRMLRAGRCTGAEDGRQRLPEQGQFAGAQGEVEVGRVRWNSEMPGGQDAALVWLSGSGI